MTTTLFVILIISIIIFDIGIGLAMAAALYADWRVVAIGTVMMIVGLVFGVLMSDRTLQRSHQRLQVQLQTTKIKLAVNQSDLDRTIHQLKQYRNDANLYRKLQADYYQQRQVQIRLQHRFNDEKSQLTN